MDKKEKIKTQYQEELNNPNEFINWFTKVNQIKGVKEEFIIPYTKIIDLGADYLDFFWDYIENNNSERTKEQKDIELKHYNDIILKEINNDPYLKNKKLFLKNGLTSFKFLFKNCIINLDERDKIINKAIDIMYNSLCGGCEISPYIIIREFIDTKTNRDSIYYGMKLNTEFRVFYDFDNKKVIGIVNYWDRDYVDNNLTDYGDAFGQLQLEKTTFNKNIDDIENVYNAQKDILIEKINKVFINNTELKGCYSVDFMYDDNKFYLIDMGRAQDSAYWNLFANKE